MTRPMPPDPSAPQPSCASQNEDASLRTSDDKASGKEQDIEYVWAGTGQQETKTKEQTHADNNLRDSPQPDHPAGKYHQHRTSPDSPPNIASP